ncbi:MAG: hypothetical protein A3B68_03395 [Candidatus Melainabacteria bacterium RIFCSPHIGHO2_02_FULL_34_12]|nr:MAG: hypothetical protein A3B68_03395 [Candidatus Melainabacteria bacterium RIFCSPHIGHO2_02_FULL_34_12]
MDILDYKEPITKIFFVRHGETEANKKHLVFGQWDIDLNKTGVKQAKDIAIKLHVQDSEPANRRTGGSASREIDYIITSPLKRAKQTAQIIAKKLGVKKIITDKNLIEKSEGLWQKKDYWQIRNEDPVNYKKWIKDPLRVRPPGGESALDLNKRVKKFQKSILKKYRSKNIIVVSHSGPIRLFLLNLLGASIDKFWHLKIKCGSITEVHISKKHSTIKSMNI